MAPGADPATFEWTCTEGRNPGSTCSKTCPAHAPKIGQSYSQGKFECVCTDECKWIRYSSWHEIENILVTDLLKFNWRRLKSSIFHCLRNFLSTNTWNFGCARIRLAHFTFVYILSPKKTKPRINKNIRPKIFSHTYLTYILVNRKIH